MPAAITLGLIAAGVLQRNLDCRRRNAIPLRIHVNGTRGKSTVTRLVANMLQTSGIRTLAKLTGESPKVMHLNGQIHWPRVGPARVQEQARFLNFAAKHEAQAVVIECMALAPEYQVISEQLIRAHIAVITNARLDHLEEMGTDRRSIARTLARITPQKGILVLGDEQLVPFVQDIAAARECRVVVAQEPATWSPVTAAVSIAQAILSVLELNSQQYEAASSYLASTRNDDSPEWPQSEQDGFTIVPLWRVNDPDSFQLIWNHHPGMQQKVCIVFNHRSDRPLRADAFAEALTVMHTRVSAVIILGDYGAHRRFRENLPASVPVEQGGRLTSWNQIIQVATEIGVPRNTPLIGCGNWQGSPPYVG